jgi:hypothetical protein
VQQFDVNGLHGFDGSFSFIVKKKMKRIVLNGCVVVPNKYTKRLYNIYFEYFYFG